MFQHLKQIVWWNSNLNVFMLVIQSYLGTWYHWAGDDPSGIDCSGLVVEGLKSIGFIPLSSDYSADGLWNEFRDQSTQEVKRGTLVFYFNTAGKATHVGVAINRTHYITADGGDSRTTSVAEAVKQNAFVKIRRIDSRSKQKKFINLF